MTFPRLTWRVGLPFVLLVLVVTTALAAFLSWQADREERRRLERIAADNVDLIQSTSLETGPELASRLRRVTGYEVFFRRRGALLPAPTGELAGLPLTTLAADGRATQLAGFECVAIAVAGKHDLLLVRALATPLLDSRVLAVLAAFVLLSAATAWFLVRGLVRPLHELARSLPQIEREGVLDLPAAVRGDEIGDLARAFLRTRAALHEAKGERERLEKLAVLVRMTAALAHEVQNPVAAIRMHAQLLRGGSAETDAVAATIEHEASRIDGLVSQWMFLTRPDPPAVAAVDLADLLATLVTSYTPQADHAAVQLALEAPPGLVANADRRRLDQVFRNLLVNALQAMPRGGVLTIRAERAGDRLRVAFADTGTGFSPTALRRFAEYFFSEKEGGMGVGLNVVQEIISAHGGHIMLKNHPQGGAVVAIELRMRNEE